MATPVPRTMLQTSDLSPDDFGILAGKVVSRTGLSGPFQLSSGTIADYTNQTGKPELVWAGGTESLPACCWIVFPGEGGAKVKIKVADPDGLGWCDEVVACVISNLERGGGVQDRYIIDDMEGPTWQVVSVTYGDTDTVVDFSADTGVDRLTLMGALNASPNLPDGWHWSIVANELVLSVPFGTGVTLVELAGGLEMEFTEPSISGTPASSLAVPMAESLAGPMDTVITQYEALLDSYAGQLANTVGVGTANSENGIEAQFNENPKIEVRWRDADNYMRVSYKDPLNGWYHPADKEIVAQTILSRTGASLSSSDPFHIEIAGYYGVPPTARSVTLRVSLIYIPITSGWIQLKIGNDVNSVNTTGLLLQAGAANDKEKFVIFKIKLKGSAVLPPLDGSLDHDGGLNFVYQTSGDNSSFASVQVIGWSR